ncbi:MAG: S9 family peptidase [Bacteroidales bacterium]
MNKIVKISLLSLFGLVAGANSSAQNNPLLKEITTNKYAARTISNLRSMNDGEHYTTMNAEKNMVVKYSYRTGLPVDTIFSTNSAKDCQFKDFAGYELSPDESKVMIHRDVEKIYRHSFMANYYVYELRRNSVKPLSENGKQQQATFSPNGRMVAFVRDNNIVLAKLDYGTESNVTTDGEYNKIINGIPDWVYEEEFAFSRAFDWAPDNSSIAFLRFDETDVKEFSFDTFDGAFKPLEEQLFYPGAYRFKYPKAGERNSKISLHTFDVESRSIKKMNVPMESDGYIPRIRFTKDATQLATFVMNRHQNKLDIYYVNPKSGNSKLVFRDESKYYVSTEMIDMTTFYDDHFVTVSEKDGYRHLYTYSHIGTQLQQLTKGDFDVTNYLGFDPKKRTYYYESTQEGAINRSIYSVDTKGKPTKLSKETGWNQASLSAGAKYFINTYSSAHIPPIVSLNDANGKTIRVIEKNDELASKIKNSKLPKKEFITLTTTQGVTLNGWIIKPSNFDPNKKYPMLMVQYSGPNSQQVKNSWALTWETALAEQGYLVTCVDGRGTGGRGSEFAKQTYLKLGQLESEDQIEAAKYWQKQSFVDQNNIAIWGWSFGGYNTLMAMSKSKGVFKAGISIAPVTDWRYYNTIYTERFMRTPQENREGYDAGSPIQLASKLEGSLLLIHGTSDDNVHYQNAVEYADALVNSDKYFDMISYTNRDHHIIGGNTRYHLYNSIIRFLNRELK